MTVRVEPLALEPLDRLGRDLALLIPLPLLHGVTISPTLDRIEAVAGVGGFEPSTAQELSEAFTVITRLGFEHHAERISAGAAPDNLIDPGS